MYQSWIWCVCTRTFAGGVYIYIYIYVCVCVSSIPNLPFNVPIRALHRLHIPMNLPLEERALLTKFCHESRLILDVVGVSKITQNEFLKVSNPLIILRHIRMMTFVELFLQAVHNCIEVHSHIAKLLYTCVVFILSRCSEQRLLCTSDCERKIKNAWISHSNTPSPT